MIKKWFLVLILKYRTKFHLSLGEHMGKDLSFIFEKKPMQWGLRGDSYLWDEMQESYISRDLPIHDSCISSHR